MDKLSEYIPLLIILVSFVVTIVGKRKKSAVTQETTLPGKRVEELFEEKKAVKPATAPPQKITNERLQRQPIERPQMPVFQHQEIQPGKEILSYISEPVMIESEMEESSSFQFEEDDAVKAIIYAEIINRKEY